MTTDIELDVRPPAYTTGVICAGVFALILPWLVVELTEDYSRAGEWMLPLATAALCALRLAVIVVGRVPRLFETFFLVFCYVFLGLAPLVLVRTRVLPPTTPYIEFYFSSYTAVVVFVAMACAVAGTHLGSLRFARSIPVGRRDANRDVSGARLGVLTWIMGISGLAYGAAFAPSLVSSRQALYQSRVSILGDLGNAIISAYIAMGLLVVFIGHLLYRRQRGVTGLLGSTAVIASIGVLLFFCVNPVSSPRFVFGTVLLGAMAALGWFSSLNRFRWSALLSIIALVFVFPASDIFRRANADFASIGSIDKSLQDPDFDSFAQFVNTVEYVDANGIEWGRQFFGAIFFWVPRAIWPNKPIDTGILLAEFKNYQFTNLSAPLPSEMYINGGIALVVLGMLCFGIFIRRWDDTNYRYFLAQGTPSVLGCAVPFYAFIMLRGSLLQSMSFLAVLLVCAWFVTPRQRTASTSKVLTPTTRRSSTC